MDNPAFRPDSEGWKLRDNERIRGNSPPVRSRSGLLDLNCWKPGPSSPLDPGSPISGHWSAACLYGVFVEIASSPGGSAGCSSPDSSRVCIAVGLERKGWKGANGDACPELVSFRFWILVELRIAPPPSPDRGAPIRFPKLLKHTFLEGNPHAASPRGVFLPSPLDSGFWILD